MPYDNEKASRLGHVPTARDPRIEQAIKQWEIPVIADDPGPVTSSQIALNALPADERDLKVAMAFDGSDMEVFAKEDYPSVTVGFVQIGGAFINLAEFWASRVNQLVDPRKLRAAIQDSTVSAVLPGGMVRLPGMTSPETWRHTLNEVFSSRGFEDGTNGTMQSLLDALFCLYGRPGAPAVTIPLHKCPTCEFRDTQDIEVPKAGTTCPQCKSRIYPTDVLRSVEEFDEYASNMTPMTRVMNVAERLFTIAVIEWMLANAPEHLQSIIVVQDGPLAFYGTTAPLKTKWIEYWTLLSTDLKATGYASPLLCGIEKSGPFVDHAAAIRKYMLDGHILPLGNDYIQRNIRCQDPAKTYGKDEFYGRRFIYRSTTSQMLVLTVPRDQGNPYEALPSPCEHVDQYPTLRATLEFLDRVQTRLYPNAVVPVALAHATASLPRGTGSEVLTVLTKETLGIT